MVCHVVGQSICQLCVEDHQGDEATLNEWLANKTEANFERWIASERHIAIVAEQASQIVGFGLLKVEGEIVLLYVSPEHRFLGVSAGLLARLEQEASAYGIAELSVFSTATAHCFYECRGYVPVGGWRKGFGVTRGLRLGKCIAP